MPRIIIQQENETIRHNKSRSYGTKYLEAGSKGGVRNAVRGFREFQNRSELRGMRGSVRFGAKEWELIAEFGTEYFCLDYVSKIRVSINVTKGASTVFTLSLHEVPMSLKNNLSTA